MIQATIFLASKKDTTTAEGKPISVLKDTIITVPKNVLDTDYFVECVQWHVFDIGIANITADLAKVNADLANFKAKKQDTAEYRPFTKAQDKRNELLTLQKLVNTGIKAQADRLKDEYSSLEEIVSVFALDQFAKMYSWSICSAKGKKVFKASESDATKGKIDTILFSYRNEDKITSLLADFNDGRDKERKTATASIVAFANETFATNGGTLYKNISYKFTVGKINDNLYTRYKSLLAHDSKGNIKDEVHPAHVLAEQLFFLCLAQLGVPTINGQKIIKIDEVGRCDTASLTISRKATEQATK